jgi:hypothetical protein
MFDAKKKNIALSVFAAALIGVSGSACKSTTPAPANSTTTGTTTTTPPGSDGSTTTTPPPAAAGVCSNCTAVTPENFVSALVQLAQSGQVASSYAQSTLTKEQSVQTGWFVIWDGGTQNYQAIHLTGSSDITGYCTNSGATCSNINPQAAALAFTEDGNKPVYSGGSNTSGTVVTNTGGTISTSTYNGSTTDTGNGVVGTYAFGNFGDEGTSQPTETYNFTTSQWVDQASGLPFINGTGSYVTGYSVAPTQNGLYTDTYGQGTLYSQNNDTRDTDLQQANLQLANFTKRAAAVSANFQMDFSKAVQLTTLSDKLTALQGAGQAISSDDRSAIMQSLSGIVGVTSDQLTTAMVENMKGNTQPTQDLVDAISKNLGMPNSATLKDQILPQLGLDLN